MPNRGRSNTESLKLRPFFQRNQGRGKKRNCVSSASQSVRCMGEVRFKQRNERTKMKTFISSVCTTLVLASSVAFAADIPSQPRKNSAEFERMKTLVGT